MESRNVCGILNSISTFLLKHEFVGSLCDFIVSVVVW